MSQVVKLHLQRLFKNDFNIMFLLSTSTQVRRKFAVWTCRAAAITQRYMTFKTQVSVPTFFLCHDVVR